MNFAKLTLALGLAAALSIDASAAPRFVRHSWTFNYALDNGGVYDYTVRKGLKTEWEHRSYRDFGGTVLPPTGWRICKIQATRIGGINNRPSNTFNGTIQNFGRQFGFYAAHPDDRNQRIRAWMEVQFVTDSDFQTAPCMHDGPVWFCGKNWPWQGGCAQVQQPGLAGLVWIR